MKAFRLSFRVFAASAALLVMSAMAPLQAAIVTYTSYLAIEGNFTSTLPGLETYRWKVEYQHDTTSNTSALVTGNDLLTAIFGPFVFSGSVTDPYGGSAQRPTFDATSSLGGVTVWDASATYTTGTPAYNGSGFNGLYSFTLGGTEISLAGANSWSYWAAGGDYDDEYSFVTSPNGWNGSGTGYTARLLGNGSFDGWGYGGFDLDYNPVAYPTGVGTTAGGFADLTTIVASGTGLNGLTYNVFAVAVPEPSRAILLLLGGMALVMRRRRTC